MTTRQKKDVLNKITEATKALKLTSYEKLSTYNFNWGFRSGLEEAARLAGISTDEIIKAEDEGMLSH